MRVVLAHPSELGPAELAAWRSMQRATSSLANPFLAPEFTVAVGAVRPGARVAVLYEGPAVAGFFPFERGRLGAGVPICGWPGTLCQGLVHAPEAELDAAELLRCCRLSAWQFDHLAEGQRSFHAYQLATAPSPIMDLANGFSAYHDQLRAKSTHFCRALRRQTRALARDVGELRFVAGSDDPALMRTLMTWKSQQYRRMGAVDNFGRPWFVELLDTLQVTRADTVHGMINALFADEKPVAVLFGLRCEGLFVGWFSAYDPAFAKYSPGQIHLVRTAEELSALGVDRIDLGRGAADYKERLKSYDAIVGEGVVTTGSVLGAAHRVRASATRRLVRAIVEHPQLSRATRGLRDFVR